MKKIRMFVASLMMLSMLVIPMGLNLTAVHAETGTGTVALTGGTMTLSAVASFDGVTLDGHDTTTPGTVTITLTDPRGSGAGWKVSMYSTQLTMFDTDQTTVLHTIDKVNHTYTGTPVVDYSVNTSEGGVAADPTVTIPSATQELSVNSSSPNDIYNAKVNTGMGVSTITVHTLLNIPAATYAGTYKTTFTFTLGIGPS